MGLPRTGEILCGVAFVRLGAGLSTCSSQMWAWWREGGVSPLDGLNRDYGALS